MGGKTPFPLEGATVLSVLFLLNPGLTKEPVLWSLVSKEPPALVEGLRGTDCDQDQKTGPTVRWDIPSVLVKDVPNFELLSPELEAGTAPSHFPLRPACSYLPSPYQTSGVAGMLFLCHPVLTATYFISGGTETLREGPNSSSCLPLGY